MNVSTIKQKALKFMSHLVTVISLERTVFLLANIYLGTSLSGLVDHLVPLWIVFVLIQVLLLLLIIHSLPPAMWPKPFQVPVLSALNLWPSVDLGIPVSLQMASKVHLFWPFSSVSLSFLSLKAFSHTLGSYC